LTLRNKDLDTIKIVQAIANELIIISEHDVECKNCHDSLKHFLEQEVDKRFLGDDDLETIYFIFEFCLLSIDCSNKVVDTLCVDSNYYMQSFVLATIGDGVYDGTEQVLKFYDENHPDDDDDNFDDDDNGSDDGDSVEVAQECLAVST